MYAFVRKAGTWSEAVWSLKQQNAQTGWNEQRRLAREEQTQHRKESMYVCVRRERTWSESVWSLKTTKCTNRLA